jgi:hypothetical protein
MKYLKYFESKFFKVGEMVKVDGKSGRIMEKDPNDDRYLVSIFGAGEVVKTSDEINKIIRCKARCEKVPTENGIECLGCGKVWK